MTGRMKIAILLFIAAMVAAAPSGVFATTQSEIEEELICLCGCGQTVKDCPHENCGFAVPARKRIADLLKEGKGKEEIMDIFVAKYGEEVLAAPKKEGFNLIGYIMPFVVLIGAALLIMVIIRSWAARGMKDEEKTLPLAKKDFGSDLAGKVEKELEEMD